MYKELCGIKEVVSHLKKCLYKTHYVVIPEEGVSLGWWIRSLRVQDKPVKMPVIVKENDDAHTVRLQRLIVNMICPEPSDRYSMKFVKSYLQICEGENDFSFYPSIIVSWLVGPQRFSHLFCLFDSPTWSWLSTWGCHELKYNFRLHLNILLL